MNGNTFRFMGWELEYFSHPYNRTAQNMRAVEIPIARRFLVLNPGKQLEIGNVLSHYQSIFWPVVDFREKGEHIINVDVMTWRPNRPYQTIVSISTLEHIGHGKYTHITQKTPAQAIEHIRTFLDFGGRALFTVPIGYNKTLDRQLAKGTMPVDEIHYMRRISDKNEWVECNLIEAAIAERPTGYRWPVALAVLFCENV